MSVNIYDGTNLIPIAGKTVPAPTPDYVDAQYSSSTTYSKGMTCIEGNVRYRYKNSTATSGHRPPDSTYWEVLSVASEISGKGKYSQETSIKDIVTMITGTKQSGGQIYPDSNNVASFTINDSGWLFLNLQTSYTAVNAGEHIMIVTINGHNVQHMTDYNAISAWHRIFDSISFWVNKGDTITVTLTLPVTDVYINGSSSRLMN